MPLRQSKRHRHYHCCNRLRHQALDLNGAVTPCMQTPGCMHGALFLQSTHQRAGGARRHQQRIDLRAVGLRHVGYHQHLRRGLPRAQRVELHRAVEGRDGDACAFAACEGQDLSSPPVRWRREGQGAFLAALTAAMRCGACAGTTLRWRGRKVGGALFRVHIGRPWMSSRVRKIAPHAAAVTPEVMACAETSTKKKCVGGIGCWTCIGNRSRV